MNAGGLDFIYAQTYDAFGSIPTYNVRTGRQEVIGSWNENFDDTEDDVGAYVRYAVQIGYNTSFLLGIP